MRPAAEVDEIALLVEGDCAVRRVDELDLVRLPLLLEVALGLVAVDLGALPSAAFSDLAPHLFLEALEGLVADGLRELEVVVEAVLDRGADGDLRPRVQAPRGLGEEVRRGVAKDVERVGVVLVARREDLDVLAVLERKPEVAHAPIRAHENGLLGELGADRARGLEPGGAVRKFELLAVGKNDFHARDRGYSGPERPRSRRDRGGLAGSGSRTGQRRRRRRRTRSGLKTSLSPSDDGSMRRLLLLVGIVPLLTGCFYLPIGSSTYEGGDAAQAQSNVRAAIPAIEAWYADHGTYAGITLEALRQQYDYGIPTELKIARAWKHAYCIESTVAGETYSFRG